VNTSSISITERTRGGGKIFVMYLGRTDRMREKGCTPLHLFTGGGENKTRDVLLGVSALEGGGCSGGEKRKKGAKGNAERLGVPCVKKKKRPYRRGDVCLCALHREEEWNSGNAFEGKGPPKPPYVIGEKKGRRPYEAREETAPTRGPLPSGVYELGDLGDPISREGPLKNMYGFDRQRETCREDFQCSKKRRAR